MGKAVSVGTGVRSMVNGPEVGVNIGVSLPAGTDVDVGSTVPAIAVDNRAGDNDCGRGVAADVPACKNGRDAHPAINKEGIIKQDRMIRMRIMFLLPYPSGAAG